MRKNVSFVVGGLRIRGMLHTPDEGKGPWPAVVLCHGFTGSRVESRFLFVEMSDELEKLGIASLRFDFRGSGESDGRFQEVTVSKEIEDTLAALRFMARRKEIANGKVGLLGLSLGGCVAACAAAEAKDLVKSLVLWSPVAVLTDVFEQRFSDDALKELDQKGYVDVGGLALCREAIEEMEHIDPLHAIAQTTCPLLVIHGTQDQVVPYNHASLYCKAARQEGRDIRKVPVRSSDHVYSSLKWRQKVISETAAWFGRTL